MKKKKDISRREFIKKVGLTAAAVGVSSSLPKFRRHRPPLEIGLIGRPSGHRTCVRIYHRVALDRQQGDR
jgi:hypothetical protein